MSDDHELGVLGHDLMGDMLDFNSGSVTFEHTDVDIPGNNALSVSIKRRLTRGILYDQGQSASFGDWEIMAPRIVATTAPGTNFRILNRCSGTNPFQPIQLNYNLGPGQTDANTGLPYTSKTYQPHEYTQGMEIQTPEYGVEKVLRSGLTGNFGPYTSSDKFVTRSNFKISCLSNISGGGEGFLAKSPDGFTYRFDRFYERRTQDDILSNYYEPDQARYRSIIAATEVTDVHGNWVRYVYDSHNRLSRIHSNDGREITLAYPGIDEPISSVTANGRTWTYQYTTRQQRYGLPPKKWFILRVRVFGYFALEGARYGEETLHT
ncbi:hypothetical protein ACFFUB_11210 [Algimonas porphyrae]|uniref:hypothetical protein n=1 Tax=Algimonas porphyrae TaxID=1128113 RepID=UPI0024E0AA78